MMKIDKIKQYFENLDSKVTFGIDGYIDEVWQIVNTRKSTEEYDLFTNMKDFAKSLYDCGHGGYANEIIRKRRVYGGFCANTGMAAAKLGAKLTMLGLFGEDGIDSAFVPLEKHCRLVSAGKPNVTQAFEFEDGKILLSHIEEAMRFDWQTLKKRIASDILREAFTKADLIALGYWSLIPAFDEILSCLFDEFIADSRCQRFFFDFADIRKRDINALNDVLKLLGDLNKKIPMTLSLNENEAFILYNQYGEYFSQAPENADAWAKTETEKARLKIGIDELIVHTPFFAVGASASEGTAFAWQRHCKNPVITTGAGDNFNGGYVAASAKTGQLTLHERLVVGNATASCYVQNGWSPDQAELLTEIASVV